MKSQVAPYKRRMTCMRIECVDGTILRFAEHPHDIKVSGQTYLAGCDFTGVEIGTGFAPSTIDLKSFIGFADITEAMLMSGKFDNAKAYIFATDWNLPVVDYEPICKAIFGKLQVEDNKYTVEFMSLIDLLNQTVGFNYSTQCPKEFGGQEPGGCLVDAVALRVTGTIDSVGPNTFFYDAARTELSDYFGWGKIWITSGDNIGIPPRMVKAFESGFIQIYEPFPYEVVAGDTYLLEPGCRKLLGICGAQYNNIINFGGFSYVPGDSILKTIGDK
jgi:uncharacterized phage protein (TIGR02218 family)